jgi:hypothetical protein
MKNKNQLRILFFTGLFVVTGFFIAAPGYSLDIKLEPPSVERTVGGKARVRIYSESADQLISMGIRVSFNPGVVQVENAAKYEDFDNGWVMDSDGDPATTDDQHLMPLVEVDNSAGTVTMMGGRLMGASTSGLTGKILLGYIDFVAVGNGSSDLSVDLYSYHPNHPTQTFDNFVKLDGTVDEPANLPGNLGAFHIGDNACQCNLNFDKSCNILDYQLFIQKWGSSTCKEPTVFCACDLNNDGSCNILDYQLFIQRWGSTTCLSSQ